MSSVTMRSVIFIVSLVAFVSARPKRDICQGVPKKLECSNDIAHKKLLEASIAAGYKVDAKGVQERSSVIVKDIKRLGNLTGVSVDEDIACFKKVLCSINVKENPFPLLMDKTVNILLNLELGKKIKNNEYVKLYEEIKLLIKLGGDFEKAGEN